MSWLTRYGARVVPETRIIAYLQGGEVENASGQIVQQPDKYYISRPGVATYAGGYLLREYVPSGEWTWERPAGGVPNTQINLLHVILPDGVSVTLAPFPISYRNTAGRLEIFRPVSPLGRQRITYQEALKYLQQDPGFIPEEDWEFEDQASEVPSMPWEDEELVEEVSVEVEAESMLVEPVVDESDMVEVVPELPEPIQQGEAEAPPESSIDLQSDRPRFQWRGDFLTDGEQSFPRKRPTGKQWKKEFPSLSGWKASIRNQQEWDAFLGFLHGRRWEEIPTDSIRSIATGNYQPLRHSPSGGLQADREVAPSDQVSSQDEAQRATESEEEVSLQEAIDQLVQTGEYSIPEQGLLSFGRRQVRAIDFLREYRFYIVEAPRNESGAPLSQAGGYYIFSTSQDAIEFAQGQLTVSQAREKTINQRRINRRGNWQERMDQTMRDYVSRQA